VYADDEYETIVEEREKIDVKVDNRKKTKAVENEGI